MSIFNRIRQYFRKDELISMVTLAGARYAACLACGDDAGAARLKQIIVKTQNEIREIEASNADS